MRRSASAVVLLVLAGCTFTGLADYDTPNCDPALPYLQDPCANIDRGTTSCLRSQCDPLTHRCSTRPLDEDKDGDPSIACGGTDCDDHDRLRSGRTIETCDGIDNDCNGVTDDALLVATDDAAAEQALAEARGGGGDLTLRADNGADGRATYLGTQVDCVRDVVLGGAATDAGCTLIHLPDAGAPTVRQPQLRSVGSSTNRTLGVAFVITDAVGTCDRETLGYFGGNVDNGRGGSVLASDCGASLPSLSSFPASPDAVIAYYGGALSPRKDPIGGCVAAAPAPLKVRYVGGATGSAPDLSQEAPPLGDSLSVRAPVLVPLPGSTALLLASPVGSSAGLWALFAGGYRVVPLAESIEGLAGARSVAVGLRDNGTGIAIVAEQGCPGQQSLTIALADLSPVEPLVHAFHATTLVPAPAALTTAPSVMWSGTRREWWVSWIAPGQQAMLVRVSIDGAHVSSPVAVGAGNAALVAASPAAAGNPDPVVFLSRPDRAAIRERVIGCPK